MEKVQFNISGGNVSVEINVKGLVTWRYTYVTDDNEFTRSSNKAGSCEHIIGKGNDILNDINSWDVQIANGADAAQNYNIVITWKQGGADIHTWSRTGKIDPGKLVWESDDAIII